MGSRVLAGTDFNDDTNAYQQGLQRKFITSGEQGQKSNDKFPFGCCGDWSNNWNEVAAEFCGVDDGLPAGLDGFKLSKAGHRVARLKGLGNAIVPQVAIEIMQAIKETGC